jgi:hypothetical protein
MKHVFQFIAASVCTIEILFPLYIYIIQRNINIFGGLSFFISCKTFYHGDTKFQMWMLGYLKFIALSVRLRKITLIDILGMEPM